MCRRHYGSIKMSGGCVYVQNGENVMQLISLQNVGKVSNEGKFSIL